MTTQSKRETRRWVVTGASRGLGLAIAKLAARNGDSVALFARGENVLNEARIIGDNAIGLIADVTDPSALARACEQVAERWGGIDVLVNNAGITRDGMFHKMTREQWDEVMGTNLNGLFNMTHPLWVGMRSRSFGRIINITSVVGLMGNAGQANYAASKAGIIGMSKSLALELASRNVTVNCIAPGFISSAMTDVLPDAQKEALNARIPAGHMGEGADIAAAAVYLASREANYVTGQTLHVNGGMAMI